MSDEGYIAVKQNEDRNYGTVAMTEEEQGPSATEEAASITQAPQQKKSREEILKTWKRTATKAALIYPTLQSQKSEHIANLALFTADRDNGDFDFKWGAGDIISDSHAPDPARPPIKGCNKKYLHWKLRRTVENIYFRLMTLLLIALDISFIIVEVVISCAGNPTVEIIRALEMALSVYFLFEVFCRVIALTPKLFFSKKSWYNIVDFVVVILAFAASIATYIMIATIDKRFKMPMGDDGEWRLNSDTAMFKWHPGTKGYWIEDTPWCEKPPQPDSVKTETGRMAKMNSRFATMIVSLRLIRIFRFVRVLRLYFEHRNLVKGVRQRISENKRRFQVDGYDLDLTYVTTNIIAMSFPSKGSKAVYRNKIDHVAKFFEDKYSDPSHIDYMIYNLCSEMEYDHRKFHGNVRRYQIDDHNVPRLEEMVKLVEDVRAWLRGGEEGRQRVVALHCKGGKGRTGTMICAVLIDQFDEFEDASTTLTYFGERRTDLNVANQFQGVETYSQIRYVSYFTEMHKKKMRVVPSRPKKVVKFNIEGLRGVGAGDGSDFTVAIIEGDKNVLLCSFKPTSEQCQVSYDWKADRLEVTLNKPPLVNKDVKFMFTCSTKGVPVGYDNCAFFFWLNTFFIKDNRELMKREQLDNPHKEKTWKVWRENFSVEVVFQDPK